MVVLIKLFYAGAIAALLILLVAYGIRTFYTPPEEPQYPQPPKSFRPAGPIIEPAPGQPAVMPTPTAEQQEFEQAQQTFQDDYKTYAEVRADYRRNVFLIAAIIGVMAVAAGLAIPSRVDAIRLGMVAGGLGCVLYGVIQAGGDLDEAGPAVVFLVTGIGLALILASGYRWLSKQET